MEDGREGGRKEEGGRDGGRERRILNSSREKCKSYRNLEEFCLGFLNGRVLHK